MNIRKLFSIGALAAMLAIFAASTAVHAEPEVTTTYNVNSALDEPDANLNKPACKSASGKCTLRAAVMQGNKQGGNIVINVPPAIYLLLHGGINEDQAKTGDLDVYGNVTIQGVGGRPVIDGLVNDRVFDLQKDSHVQLKNLTIQNGYVQFDKQVVQDTFGGGIRARSASATLTDVQVIHNFAYRGGGISNFGKLTVISSTISNNHGRGGGIYNRYWNDYFAAELHMFYSTVSNNDAGTPLAGDTLPGEGGGILNEGAKLYVSNSTLYKNHAGYGGGVANTYKGQVYMVNATLSANKAEYDGGAIHNFNPSAPHIATVQLSNVTIVGNRAAASLSKAKGGGIFNSLGDVVTVRNSIVAKNQRYIPANYLADDCAGSFASGGYNLIGSNLGCAGFVNGSNGDQVGTVVVALDPKLGSLAWNGGPTKTHAPLQGSPAIDKGNWTGCRDHTTASVIVDQRGYVRSVDGDKNSVIRCDIGAIEYGAH